MKILGLIPARAGSKRVPNKNVKPLNGKPLIAYTIEAANRSRHINRVVVSTNSDEISGIAERYGAEVPFLRPNEISGSDSTEMEFFEHALDWFEKNESYVPDLIVLLYPTSPLRRSETIDRAIETILENPEADSLRSIRKCTEHPYKMWQIEDGCLKSFVRDEKRGDTHTLSYHLLPEVYIQNASIYITKPSTIRDLHSTTGNVIIPFIMNRTESIDINDPEDFILAEIVIKSAEKEVHA